MGEKPTTFQKNAVKPNGRWLYENLCDGKWMEGVCDTINGSANILDGAMAGVYYVRTTRVH